MSEAEILAEIRLALGMDAGVVLWRNSVGLAFTNGRPIHYGLAVGSSDLLGICDGRFVALEVKTSAGRVAAAQAQFLDLVRAKGGFACVVRSPEEALAAIARCRAGASE